VNNGIAIEVKTGFLSKNYVHQMIKDSVLRDIGGLPKSHEGYLDPASKYKIQYVAWHIFRNSKGEIGYDIDALEFLKDLGIDVIFHY